MYDIVIRHLYNLQSDHLQKPIQQYPSDTIHSYYSISVLIPMQYFTSPWLHFNNQFMPLTSPCRQAQAQEQSCPPTGSTGSTPGGPAWGCGGLVVEDRAESKGPAGPGGWQTAETHPGLLDSGGGGGNVWGGREGEKSMPSLPSTKPITYWWSVPALRKKSWHLSPSGRWGCGEGRAPE